MLAFLPPLALIFGLIDLVEQTIATSLVTDEESAQLEATAPRYLTATTAKENLGAAQVASTRYRVGRSLILAIAHHESRYQPRAITREARGLTSCGVMTPSPKARCNPGNLLDGYLDGAKHLREWLDATGNHERTALLGYAGGWRLINACSIEPVLRHKTHGDDLCLTPDVFRARAKWIAKRANKPTQ